MRKHIVGSVVLLSISVTCLAVEIGGETTLAPSSESRCSGSFESGMQTGPGIASGQDKAGLGKPCAQKQLETKNQPVDHRILPLLFFLQALRSSK